MKKLIFSFMLLLTMHSANYTKGDDQALAPRITREQKWEQYEKNRLAHTSPWEKIKEFCYEWKESIKHIFLLDILFFKNNRITTDQAQEILKKFGRNLNNVTILDKPMAGPACTIFNTIIIDHKKMSKLTKEEQAFILGHEIVHLKKKDWLTRLLFALFLEQVKEYGLNKVLNNPKPIEYFIFWLILEAYVCVPLSLKLSRYQEKRCDLEAAKTLGLARAGASAFEKIRKKWISQQEVPLNPNGIWHNLQTWFGIKLSHPELHDRTEYLLELAEKQERL